jgi:hypothetical protein
MRRFEGSVTNGKLLKNVAVAKNVYILIPIGRCGMEGAL